LQRALRGRAGGEGRFDAGSRAAYARLAAIAIGSGAATAALIARRLKH
jgi:hypothetical protein